MIYKDDTPQNTIKRIKNILDNIGIKTKEFLYENRGICYSCRITLANQGLESLDIGVNGKGMSPEYSLASGYAELMERLQNKFLVNEAMRHSSKIPNGRALQFRFFPDEMMMRSSLEDFFRKIKYLFPNYDCEHQQHLCEKLIGLSDKSTGQHGNKIVPTPQMEWLVVPFAKISPKGNSIENVPIILARANSSTGLCAGNTPQEAILQGINEIFERYVLQQLYIKCITPPSYPKEYFAHTDIADRLDRLEADGYIYDVKDMSLEKGFPVVGLILTNTRNGTTMFRLGADLSPEIALERCLTEIYQGRTEEHPRFIEYPHHSFVDIESNPHYRNNEYKKSLKDGTGFFPKSIFAGSPSYQFQHPVLHRSGSSTADFRNMVQFLYENDYILLIRDNSFLGFCAYQVMIPGLSDQDHRLRDIFAEYFSPFDIDKGNVKGVSRERDAEQWPLYHVKAQADVRDFVEKHYPNEDNIRLFPYNTAPQNTINKHLLLFLAAVKNSDYLYANKHFAAFMEQRDSECLPYNPYLACVGSYVLCKSAKMKNEEITSWLYHFYKKETIMEVLSDFRYPQKIMKNYAFPTCFDCNNCPLQSSCHYCDAIAFDRMIQQIQLDHPIDQSNLFHLLD